MDRPRRVPLSSRATRLLAVLTVTAFVVGCSPTPVEPSSSPSPSVVVEVSPVPSATGELAGRAGDLDLLLRELVTTHPDPFAGEDPAAFEARVRELAARADGLTDDEFLVEVMRLVGGRDRDGHTGLVPFAQDRAGVTAWPIALYDFDEGLYVVDALAPHEDLEGLRVVEIGGRPVAEVAAAVTPLVSRDNEGTVRARLPGYLVVPAVLRGLALLPDGSPALTLERPDGTRVERSPEAIPMDQWVAWRDVFNPLVPMTLPADDGGPRHLRNRDEHFWSEIVDDAMYVGYHQVQSGTASGGTIAGLARAVDAALDGGDVSKVIVDIRGNPGGENGSYPPLRDALIRQAASAPGSVVVLIGRSTFSAAGNLATELRAAPGVRFIGEPTGAAPNMWGDADVVTLPFSKLVVHIATREWIFAPDDDSLAVEPDVTVPVRWAEHAAGIDAAYDAALAD